MKLSVEIPLVGPALDALASAVAARLLESMDAKSPPSGIPYLDACYAAEYDDDDGERTESPAIGPFCGCTTCVVREVLWAGWQRLLELRGP